MPTFFKGTVVLRWRGPSPRAKALRLKWLDWNRGLELGGQEAAVRRESRGALLLRNLRASPRRRPDPPIPLPALSESWSRARRPPTSQSKKPPAGHCRWFWRF